MKSALASLGTAQQVSHAAKKEGSVDRNSKDEKPKDYSKVESDESKVEEGGDHGHGGSGNPNAAFSIWLGILIDGTYVGLIAIRIPQYVLYT